MSRLYRAITNEVSSREIDDVVGAVVHHDLGGALRWVLSMDALGIRSTARRVITPCPVQFAAEVLAQHQRVARYKISVRQAVGQ